MTGRYFDPWKSIFICLFFFFNSCLTADPPAGSWLEVQYTRELTYVQHTDNNLSCEEYDSQMWHKCVPVVLFLVDRGTNNFFFRLRSDVFYSESLFQTNHLVHLNTSRQGIFLVWRHDFFVLVLRDVHLQHVYLQEESSPSWRDRRKGPSSIFNISYTKHFVFSFYLKFK